MTDDSQGHPQYEPMIDVVANETLADGE